MALPEVQHEIFDGLIASAFNLDEYVRAILDKNPNVFALLSIIEQKHGRKALACAVAVYRLLDAQADCDDLVKRQS